MVRKGLVVGLVVAVLLVVTGVMAYTAGGKCPLSKVEKGLWCNECKAAVVKEDLKDGKCAKCGKAPEEADLCIATGWYCEADKMWATKAGDCEKCKGKCVEKTVKARVIYKCPKCGAESPKEMKCDKDKVDCEKTCTESGKGPHSS